MPSGSEPDADEPLKRLGGGRWETRDGRFTIEPASGTWSVVDAEETDDLGLPLVRGPFRRLTDAKAAIATARQTAAPASPLAARVRESPRRPPVREARRTESAARQAEPERRRSGSSDAARDGGRVSDAIAERRRPTPKTSRHAADAPAAGEGSDDAEPRWLEDLSAAERGRARRLIERLTDLGIADADSIVRRDLIGDVPAVAAAALERRLAALPGDAELADVVDLVVDGRDEELAVRWRLVDGDGRPILIDLRELRRARR